MGLGRFRWRPRLDPDLPQANMGVKGMGFKWESNGTEWFVHA